LIFAREKIRSGRVAVETKVKRDAVDFMNKPGWQTVVNTNDCSMGITLFILHSEARLAAISQMFITNHSCLNFRIHRQSTMPIHPATL